MNEIFKRARAAARKKYTLKSPFLAEIYVFTFLATETVFWTESMVPTEPGGGPVTYLLPIILI